MVDLPSALLGALPTAGLAVIGNLVHDRLRDRSVMLAERGGVCADLAAALRRYSQLIFFPMYRDDPTLVIQGGFTTDEDEAELIKNPPDEVVRPFRDAYAAVEELRRRHPSRDLDQALVRAHFAWACGRGRPPVGLPAGIDRRECLMYAADFIQAVGKRGAVRRWLGGRRWPEFRVQVGQWRRESPSVCLGCMHRHPPPKAAWEIPKEI